MTTVTALFKARLEAAKGLSATERKVWIQRAIKQVFDRKYPNVHSKELQGRHQRFQELFDQLDEFFQMESEEQMVLLRLFFRFN